MTSIHYIRASLVPSSRQPAKSRFLDDILRQGLSPDRSVSRSSNGFSKGSSRLNAWDSSSTPSRLSKKSTQTLDDFQMPYSKEDSRKKMVEEKRSQNAKEAHIKQKHFLSQKQRQSNKDRFNLALSKTANSEHHSRHDIESISSLPALQTDAPSPSYLNRRNTNGPTIFGSPLYKQAFESSSPHCEDIDVEPSGFNHMKGKPPSKIKKRMRTISTTHKVVSHSAAKPHRHSLPANFDLAYIFVPLEDDFIKEPHGDLVKITKSHSAKVDIDDYNEELEIKHVKEDEVKEVKESESEGDDIKEDIWVEGSSEEDDDDDGDDEEDVIEEEQEENKRKKHHIRRHTWVDDATISSEKLPEEDVINHEEEHGAPELDQSLDSKYIQMQDASQPQTGEAEELETGVDNVVKPEQITVVHLKDIDQYQLPGFICPSSETKSREAAVKDWLKKTTFPWALRSLPLR